MKKSLSIAMMVRSYIPWPRPIDMIYAPIDLAIATAKGLAERGHKVTVFAPLGSQVYGENITIESLNLRSLVNNQEEFTTMLTDIDRLMHDFPGLWDRYMSNEMFRRANAGEFDVLHFHHPEVAMSRAVDYPKIPVVYTLHDPVGAYYREVFDLYQSPNQRFVSISNNQRRDAPDLPYIGTVYNGTDTKLFEFHPEAEDYLLYAGRITPEKGIREAIQVARGAKKRLLIIGPVPDDEKHRGYFDQYIKPELDDKILYLGRVDQDRLPAYYQKAIALLTPVQWEEPFGLTTIEAMACGTPVISLKRGAASEIIENGKNGFICDSIHGMVEAVEKVDSIDRRACRTRIERKFSLKQMVDGYEKVLCEAVESMKPSYRSQLFLPRDPKRVKANVKKIRSILKPKK